MAASAPLQRLPSSRSERRQPSVIPTGARAAPILPSSRPEREARSGGTSSSRLPLGRGGPSASLGSGREDGVELARSQPQRYRRNVGSACSTQARPSAIASVGAVELHQADAAQPRDQHDMRRLAGQARARDVVLHDVEGGGEHVEIARRRFPRRRGIARRPRPPPTAGPAPRAAGPPRGAGRRATRPAARSSSGGSGSTAKRRARRSPLRLTAMITSAPSARQTETGIGLLRPPSTSHLPSMRAGLRIPGRAIEARTASWIGPDCSQISRPVAMSVATAA